MTDEKEALRQAMEAIFYERDAGETPPPNLRILEKSRFPHEDRGEEESAAPGACYYGAGKGGHRALARGTRARASLIESY